MSATTILNSSSDIYLPTIPTPAHSTHYQSSTKSERTTAPSIHSLASSSHPISTPADPTTTDPNLNPDLTSSPPNDPSSAFTPPPDGGLQAWLQIFTCALFLFFTNGFPNSWGVLQAAILRSPSSDNHSSTTHGLDTVSISFVGSLALGCLVAFSLIWVRVMRILGAKSTCLLAAVLMSLGPILASLTLHNLGGLFVTVGLMFGVGACALYTAGNSLPVQWFSSRLGLSNGLVKVGGGIGATVLPVASQALIERVGLAWTFRVLGMLMFVTTVPGALLLKERRVANQSGRVDWALLRNGSFLCLALGGAVSTFALFVPPFFIPLFASSIGLSPATGAGLVAGFGLSSTTGRLVAGLACDKIGPLNTMSITLVLNAVSMLAIWPVSSSLGPLILFAALNGVANGSFFSSMPMALSSLAGPGFATGAMGIGTSLWTPGYLLGSSVAGILISKTGAAESTSIEPYRAAIFYAGGVATLGSVLVFVSRFKSNVKLVKKL